MLHCLGFCNPSTILDGFLITVADIIAEADVSKATFYRYFHDKYDVMNSNYKELLDGMMPETLRCYWMV